MRTMNLRYSLPAAALISFCKPSIGIFFRNHRIPVDLSCLGPDLVSDPNKYSHFRLHHTLCFAVTKSSVFKHYCTSTLSLDILRGGGSFRGSILSMPSFPGNSPGICKPEFHI